MINDVRKKKLKLRPVTCLSGSQGSELDIPHAYIWSPHLVPKQKGPSTNKRKRGRTQMQSLHGRSDCKLVMLYELYQPMGPNMLRFNVRSPREEADIQLISCPPASSNNQGVENEEWEEASSEDIDLT